MPNPPEPKSPGLLGAWEFFALEDGLPNLKAKHPVRLPCLGLGCALCWAGLLLAVPSAAQTFFTDVTQEAVGEALFGARARTMGDYDNDGWPDVFRSEQGGRGRIALLHNEGNGRFVDQTGAIQAEISPNFKGGGPIFGDYDNDGDLDLFVPVGSWNQNGADLLLRNDQGVFHDVASQANLTAVLPTDNALWLDYDRDGYIDLYTGNLDCGQNLPEALNKLYRNQGDGSFADVTSQAGLDLQMGGACSGGSNGGMAAGDFDSDGWPDLYVAVFLGPNRLFLNTGQGGFRDATTKEIGDPGEAYGVAVGDIDNDGDLDIFQPAGGGSGIGAQRSLLLLNLGAAQFLDVTEGVGLSALGNVADAGLGDIDNDGDLDLTLDFPGLLFLNQGGGTFVEGTSQSGIAVEGQTVTAFPVSFGDYDLDGFLDSPGWDRLFRGNSNGNHSLRVELVGLRSNRSGIGSRLIATSGELQQMQEVLGGRGFHQDELVAHFGLGQRTKVDRLEIRWPSGQVDVLEEIPADQKIRVFEGRAEYHVVQPIVWESPPSQILVVGADAQIDARLRVALFEPEARVTRAVADLRPLGGPGEVPLQDQGDGVYALHSQVRVAGPNGVKTLSVQLEQSTSLGPYWSQVSRAITVFPVDEPLFAEGLEGDWHLTESRGVEVEPHSTGEVYEGSFALGLKANTFSLTYKLEHPLAAVGYAALRFAFHPGEARVQGPQEGEPVSRIAFEANGEIYVMEADGGDLLNLTNHPAWDASPAWSPDGQQIAFSSDRDGNVEIYVMEADGGDPINLTNNNLSADTSPAWSPDGRKIAFSSASEDGEIYVMEADGSNSVNLTNHTAWAWDSRPAWSPDGKKIAFDSWHDGNLEIYVMDADGSNPVNLTNHPANDFAPAWSPDGKKIAFESNRDGNEEIYVMEADGGDPVNLTNHPASDFAPAWSPDGKKIAFSSDRDGNGEIYVMDADGTSLFNLSTDRAGDGNPKWLPTVAPAPIPAKFGVVINNNLVRLIGRDLEGIGVDMEQKAWQVVEIPLALVGSFGPEISSIRFVGNLEGTFYLDDIRLVAATPPPATVVEEERTAALPQSFSLSQNYPNPFNSSTVIRFELPQSGEVELAIYNLAGQQVAKLVEGVRETGAYTIRWDGRDEGGKELASGVYLCRLRAGGKVETRKLLLLR